MASVKKRKVDQVGRPCRNGMKWPMRGRDFYEIWEIAVMTEMFASQNHSWFLIKKIMEIPTRWIPVWGDFSSTHLGGANLSCFKCRQNSKVIPTVDLTNLGSANFLMCWISNSWDGLRNTSRTQQVRWKWHCQPCRIKMIKENLRLRQILSRKKGLWSFLESVSLCHLFCVVLITELPEKNTIYIYILAAYYYILHTISYYYILHTIS